MNLKALAETKLRGNEPDILGLVEDLFAYTRLNQFVAGREQDNAAVSFELADGTILAIPVDCAMGRFRMICARLCVLANDLNPALANIYRGFCTMPYDSGVIRIECENTLANHYFRLTYYDEANQAAAAKPAREPLGDSPPVERGLAEPGALASSHMTPSTRIAHVGLAEALTKGPPPSGNLAVPIFSHGSLVVELYSPVGHDPQKPHTRDEVYFVTRGTGSFFDGERRHAVEAGSFLFVAAGQIHRFEDFSSDFVVWVVFYGPEGGEADA